MICYNTSIKWEINLVNIILQIFNRIQMKRVTCTLCRTNKKEYNIKCRCKVEKVRKRIFELEEELDLKRMKNMKENFEFERKMYLGRYIRNRIKDSARFFVIGQEVVRILFKLGIDEDEALNIYDEYGEDVFEDIFNK